MLHISENQKPGLKITYSDHCSYIAGMSVTNYKSIK